MQLMMLGEWMLLIVRSNVILEHDTIICEHNGRTCGKVVQVQLEGPASQLSQLLGFGDFSAQEEWAKIDRDGSGSMDGKELRCY